MKTKTIDKKQVSMELKKEQQEYEKTEYIKIENIEEKKAQFKTIVKENINKRKPIHIKPLEADIIKIKSKALSKGIPYQTLINSIIHQFANDKLVEKSAV